MNPRELISEACMDGVKIAVSADDSISAAGEAEAVEKWLPILRANKNAILQALLPVPADPSPEEWLTMLRELDALIEEFYRLAKLPEAGIKKALAARHNQPLSSIPDTLAWYRHEVELLRRGK